MPRENAELRRAESDPVKTASRPNSTATDVAIVSDPCVVAHVAFAGPSVLRLTRTHPGINYLLFDRN